MPFWAPKYLELVRADSRRRAIVRDLVVRVLSHLGIVRLALLAPIRTQHISDDDQLRISRQSDFVSSRNLLIFAHYDIRGILSLPDKRLLKSFKDAGYDIVLVSTAAEGEAGHNNMWSDVSSLCRALITRGNTGLDFGSWAAAITLLQPMKMDVENLLLLNNSVYGPVRDLGPIVGQIQGMRGVVGLTGSREFLPHLQSYCLSFSGDTVRSPYFSQYWLKVPKTRSKRLAILRNELTLERKFTQQGFQCRALFVDTRQFPRNPYTFLYRDLVQQGFPFLKKSLFVHNYDELDFNEWHSGLGIDPAQLDEILEDVEALRNHR